MLALLTAAAAQEKQPIRCPAAPSVVNFKVGEYVTTSGIRLHFTDFRGRMLPRGRSVPECLVKTTHVDHGKVLIKTDELSQAFNQKLASGSSISDLKLRTEGKNLKISGTANQGVPVPFEISGPLRTTSNGKIEMKAKSLETMELPIGEVLNLFGTELDDLFGGNASAGVQVNEDTVLFDPEKLMQMRGHVTAVQLVPNGVVLVFGNPPAQQRQQRTQSHPDPRSQGRKQLPATASALPAAALAGLFLLVFGAATRRP